MAETEAAKAVARAAATRAAHLNWLGMVRAGSAATEGERTADVGDVAEAWKATGRRWLKQ